jgi:outer membrane protein TolC
MKKISILLALLCATYSGFSQSALSLEKIIALALQSNYDVAIATNNISSANNNATKAQAGYLPNLNLNSGLNYSRNNTNLTFGGVVPDIEKDGVENTSYNVGVGFNYLVFNGFGRVHTYQSLMNTQQLTSLQSKIISENLVLDIVTRYLDIQQANLNLDAALDNIKISQDRLKRVTIGNENGSRNKLDVLSAQVDLNNDSLSILSLQTAIQKQLASLNTLMGRDPYTAIEVAKLIPIPAQQSMTVLREQALQNNATLLLAQVAEELAMHQTAITESRRLPTVNMTGNYGYNNAQNGAGVVLSQKTLGFSSGLTVTMPIFNGFQLTTALKNAELNQANKEIELKKAKLSIQNQLRSAELDIELMSQTITAQAQNIELAKTALERAQLSYSNGTITFNDLRIAQLNILLAQNNLNQAKINLVKVYYTTARLAGGLLTN